MLFTGKLRLVYIAVAIVAVIVAFTVISSRSSSSRSSATPAPSASVGQLNLATAAPEIVNTIKSWGLTLNDLPPGTTPVSAQEIPLYLAARNDPAVEKSLQAQGFITGYEQQWRQASAQFELANTVDVFNTPDQAKARLLLRPNIPPTGQYQELSDPKLGDASRMFSILTSPSGAQQQIAYAVEWTRGRTLLTTSSASLPGALRPEQILALAHTIDERAASAPLK